MSETSVKTEATSSSTDFIRTIINQHLEANTYDGRVVTRFPPEPNGFLHIGHAKSICLNFGIANDYSNAVCHLRMDDTDPTKEDLRYVSSIQEDVKWLGFDWGNNLFYASDYFEQLYQYAMQLIEQGKAYVCSLNEEEIRSYRGTVTEAGKNSPYRERSIEENRDLFQRMRAGEFEDGTHVVRAKIDMASANMKMRDPLLYRIRHETHYRTGDQWCIYPMYDFAHCLSDSIERITHSICTLEFENNRELYDWILDAVGVEQPPPKQYEFARLNMNYTVMSKRKLLALVENNTVSGWDDPRIPTISGLRRRGYTPEAIRNFCNSIGIAKSNSVVDIAQLEHSIRDDLNQKAPRVLAVLNPLRVVIDNYDEHQTEELNAPYYPHDVPKEGSRSLPFSKVLYIERDDFMENPPKKFYRLSPGGEVRLRHAYVIQCTQVIKDETTGDIIELRCTYDPATKSGSDTSGKKVKGTIHWVSADHGVPAEFRLYEHLFLDEDPNGDDARPNPNSLQVLQGVVEPSLKNDDSDTRYQFERHGYFYPDPVDSKPEALVFNRIVPLRDSWEKQTEPVAPPSEPKVSKPTPSTPTEAPKAPTLTTEQETQLKHYTDTLHLPHEMALTFSLNSEAAAFFEAACKAHNNAPGLANWIANELLGELGDTPLSSIPFGPEALAELVALIDDDTISGKIGKEVLTDMMQGRGTPKTIVEEKGLQQISDPAALTPMIESIIANNPNQVAQYKGGNTKLFGFFVGQVMKASQGKANPTLVTDLLKQHLS